MALPPRTASPATPPSNTQTAPEVGLTDIVVTAQRRSESAQRAGLAISVLSSSTITERGITNPAELSRLVPAVQISPAGGSATFVFLRGVGNFAFSGYTDPAIAFNYDGVYIGRATATLGLIYDLDRIEVLKGPQGTLYGRNATSGALNVIPARPKLGETSGSLTASYGNYNALNFQGAVNLALGDASSIRIAGARSRHDGYLSDGTSDEDLKALRLQALVNLTDQLTVRIAGDYAKIAGSGSGSNYVASSRYDAPTGRYIYTPAGLDSSIGLLDPRSQAYRQTRFSGLAGRTLGPLDRAAYVHNRFYGTNAELTWKSPIGTLSVIPAYRRGKVDSIFTTAVTSSYQQEKDQQTSVEARLAADRLAGTFDYILGVFYFKETVKGNYTFNQQFLAPFQDFTSKTAAKAAYGRITAHVSDRLRLIGGIRYTSERKNFVGAADLIQVICTVRIGGVPTCPNAPTIPTVDTPGQVGFNIPAVSGGVLPAGTSGAIIARVITAVNAKLKTNKPNFRAALEFDIAPRSLFYASFENGFRSGAFSLSAGHETYNPEFINAYTLGMKNRFLDNRLQLNVEAFLWKYRDQQVSHPGFDRNNVQGQFTENVGRSTNKGVELETTVLPFPDTLLSGVVQYLEAKYDSFVFQTPAGNTPPATGCSYIRSPTSPALYDVNCSGKPAFQAPKWTINLAGQQTLRFGRSKITLAVDTQYKSSRVIGFDYLPFQTVRPTWTTGAQIGLSPSGLPLTVSGYVQNIENHRIPVTSYAFGVGSVYSQITTAPRTYGVRLSAKF